MNVLKAINERGDTIDILVNDLVIESPSTMVIETDTGINFKQFVTNNNGRRGYCINLINRESENTIRIEGIKSFSIERKFRPLEPTFTNRLNIASSTSDTTTTTIKLSYDLTLEMINHLESFMSAKVNINHYSFDSTRIKL